MLLGNGHICRDPTQIRGTQFGKKKLDIGMLLRNGQASKSNSDLGYTIWQKKMDTGNVTRKWTWVSESDSDSGVQFGNKNLDMGVQVTLISNLNKCKQVMIVNNNNTKLGEKS